MLIGFDLDNTLLDYSDSVRMAAAEKLPNKVSDGLTKESLKLQIQENFGGEEWTRLQGLLYTSYIQYATIDPYAIGLLNYLNQRGKHRIQIVSHKTRFPILGPQVDMREIASQHFDKLTKGLLGSTSGISIHFTETLVEKIEYINETKFDIFVDDLLEVISRLNIKNRILFSNSVIAQERMIVSNSWQEIAIVMKERLGC